MWWRGSPVKVSNASADGETTPNTALVLVAKVRLTAKEASDLQQTLHSAVDRADRVIVDLARVEVMTPAVVATLLVEQANAEYAGRSVELVGLSTAAKMMSDLSDAQNAFTSYTTLEETLALGVARQQTRRPGAVAETVNVAHLQLTAI